MTGGLKTFLRHRGKTEDTNATRLDQIPLARGQRLRRSYERVKGINSQGIIMRRRCEQKVDSRFFLPVEMLIGCYSIAWGFYGGLFTEGALYQVLNPLGQTREWLALVAFPGIVLSLVSWIQYRHGHDWSVNSIKRAAGIRALCSATLSLSWLYVVRMLQGEGVQIYVLAMLAPVSFVFCAWSFVENEKVRYAIKHMGSSVTHLQFYR